MDKRHLILEITCGIVYSACAIGGILTERLPWLSILMAAEFGLCGVGSLISDTDFRNKKTRPTVRTIGLFALMIVFICLAFK